jgi:thiamine-phosphate pyrophosphorylase
MTEPPTGCRLYAVVDAGEGADDRLTAALAAADISAVLVAPGAGQLDAAAARPLVEQARRAGVTALVLDDAGLARAVGAGGVHLTAHDSPEAAYTAARERLGQAGVVGVDPGISRHAAMLLAEAGADYVGFGAPAHLKDRDKARARREELIAWWAQIFEVPCVAFDVETPEEAERLAAAGADFIAVSLSARLAPPAVRTIVGEIAHAVHSSKPSS